MTWLFVSAEGIQVALSLVVFVVLWSELFVVGGEFTVVISHMVFCVKSFVVCK